MDPLLIISRLLVVVIGVVGYIFGQLFFGPLKPVPTICAVAAILAALLGWVCGRNKYCSMVVAALSGTAVVCVLIEAANYYAHNDIPGNDFAWEFKLPFIAALMFIGYRAVKVANRGASFSEAIWRKAGGDP